MEEQIVKAKPAISFEYELFEEDPYHLTTVVSTLSPTCPWINPASLNFKYRIGQELDKHSPVGILHSIQRDGSVSVGLIGLETLWRGKSTDIEMTGAYYVGEFVRLKANVLSPRFEWPRKGGGGAWATGRISQVLPNGCLVVKFPGRLVFGDEARSFLADPYEVGLVSFDTCPGLVEKYQHVEDFHWAVRPVVIAFGLFTAMKCSLFVGRNIRAKVNGQKSSVQGQSGGNSAWLPPTVANLFKEGAFTATAR